MTQYGILWFRFNHKGSKTQRDQICFYMKTPSSGFRFYDLAGRTLVLTGVTRGIGKAILPYLLEQGLRIVAISRGMDRMQKIRQELGASEEQLFLYDCDFADTTAVQRVAQEIAASGLAIDGILHNAAIDTRQWFEKADDAFWNNLLQINLLSSITLTRHLLPVLRKSDQGRIIFTGSVIFDLGGSCLTAYAASKGAIVGVTRSLAHELQGSGITVNCLVPGAISVEKEGDEITDALMPWQSVQVRLQPKDLAGTICLLLSQSGRGITSQTITVDAGIVHPLAGPDVQGKNCSS